MSGGPEVGRPGPGSSARAPLEAFGPGKVILLGEHAVVYGHPALAVPLSLGITARGVPDARCRLELPPGLSPGQRRTLRQAFARAAEAVGQPAVRVTLRSTLPISMGLGSSAALAVAVSRLLLQATGRRARAEKVLELALQMEQAFHGTPSGVDHSCSTHGTPILYRRPVEGGPGRIRRVRPGRAATLLLALAGPRRATQETVAALRARQARWPGRYARLFEAMGQLALEGTRALEAGDLESLGDAMNLNHGLLVAAGVSSPVLDAAVDALRKAGAVGAKLTGAGGDGGAVVALFPHPPRSLERLRRAGLTVFQSPLEPAR